MENVFHKLHLSEWVKVQRIAKQRFQSEVLGTRPTFDKVRAELPNPHTISALEWVAMLVLLVLTAFTSYKVGALGIPFAEHTLDILTQHTYISPWVATTFKVITALLFMLLATPSVIYFKLLDREPEVTAEKRETRSYKWYKRFSLDYLTPRLPFLVVYLSIAWLVVVSSQLPGTPFEQYLPVVVEVALATLVGNILKKRKDFNLIVWDALRERTDPYDSRLKSYEVDGAYLKLLYQTMREALLELQRPEPGQKRPVKVNAWLETTDEQTVYQLVKTEYRRLTDGASFAEWALTPVDVIVPAESINALRVPPNGEKTWTPDALAHDLRVRGIDPTSGYNEAAINADYEPGYNARQAWRTGAKTLFQSN